MKRRVQPELLDDLPPESPDAIRSRKDLGRINQWMGNAQVIGNELICMGNSATPLQIWDIGGGDGGLMFRTASRLARRGQTGTVTVVDKHRILNAERQRSFEGLGWSLKIIHADAFEWIRQIDAPMEIVVANLFLHHFENPRLSEFFQLLADKARALVAVDPRRAFVPLGLSRLLWAICCNHVTRHDARLSVLAGFRGQELTGLWPDDSNWSLREYESGISSHVFVACRAGKQAIG